MNIIVNGQKYDLKLSRRLSEMDSTRATGRVRWLKDENRFLFLFLRFNYLTLVVAQEEFIKQGEVDRLMSIHSFCVYVEVNRHFVI